MHALLPQIRAFLLISGFSLAASLVSAGGSVAYGQYATSFYYHNSRTGMTYSQNVGVGRHSAYGGFSYSRNGRHYSAGSGYRGENYYGGMAYSNGRTSYSQGAAYGRGYYYGGTAYGTADPQPVLVPRQPGVASGTAAMTLPE